jgi:hypothetical protein
VSNSVPGAFPFDYVINTEGMDRETQLAKTDELLAAQDDAAKADMERFTAWLAARKK